MKAGEFLKQLRTEKKLSLRQMAYKTELSHTFISEIEKGNLNGTIESQEKILTALEATPSDKKFFYKLSKLESLPSDIRQEMEKMEEKIIILETELENYKEEFLKQNLLRDSELYKIISKLNEKEKEKVIKFIDEYIK